MNRLEDLQPELSQRIDAALAELSRRGIVTLRNAGPTASIAWQRAHEHAERQPDAWGVVFYHQQDAARVFEGGGLSLSFGALNDDDDQSVRVGRLVCDVMAQHRVPTEWGGSVDWKIEIPANAWHGDEGSGSGSGSAPSHRPAVARLELARAPDLWSRCTRSPQWLERVRESATRIDTDAEPAIGFEDELPAFAKELQRRASTLTYSSSEEVPFVACAVDDAGLQHLLSIPEGQRLDLSGADEQFTPLVPVDLKEPAIYPLSPHEREMLPPGREVLPEALSPEALDQSLVLMAPYRRFAWTVGDYVETLIEILEQFDEDQLATARSIVRAMQERSTIMELRAEIGASAMVELHAWLVRRDPDERWQGLASLYFAE